MNEWVNYYNEHNIHKTLDELLDFLHNNVDMVNSNSSDNLSHISSILIKTKQVIDSIDPTFYPTHTLDEINELLTCNSFKHVFVKILNNRDFDYNEAKALTNSLVEKVYKLSAMTTNIDENELFNSISSRLTKKQRQQEKEIIDLRLTLEFTIGEAREKLNSINALEESLRERSSQVKDIMENNDKMMLAEKNRRREEFTSEQKLRHDTFLKQSEETLKTITEKTKSIYKNQEEQIDKRTSALFQKIADSSNDITEKHNSIKDIYELVAEDGIAGGYKKNADDEKSAANLWRGITMGCYALIILWVLFKNTLGFETFINNQVQWPVLIITISITAIAFIAAQFSSKQSRIHLINEQKMRWFALEVKAIDPFISSLPENEKNDLKKQLSEKLFCQHRTEDVSNETESHSKSLDALSSVVHNLTDTIKTITKK
ncbi:hypothetical protein [Vreelandella boliviensis]|uniref:Uncharacterized protein n=1 Tax=Vreelandella boliviensis LC1 TaxID=1072583 RepID=A0A265DTE0_9GAMM|nr:hypothetical protein [Halomonas boliviensis]EHJ91094.1 hypothetical protein KUC_3918 [Halomonas boliviensis LC1]OZT72572.1 hypothetical protein CE457_18755 [Halomonas boliviensis LC1]